MISIAYVPKLSFLFLKVTSMYSVSTAYLHGVIIALYYAILVQNMDRQSQC